MKNKMNLEEMLDELEAYYESAGFENYRKNCLEGKTEEEICQLYKNTFEE